jgi:outer membrane immunogenic protein
MARAMSWEISLCAMPLTAKISGVHMRKLAAHVTAFTLFAAGTAVAADLRMPVKAPPPVAPAPVYSWTGCYVGGGGGYGLIDVENRHRAGNWDLQRFDAGGRGWFGTVQVGCDYQVSSTWVIGAFADYDFSDIKVRTSHPNFGIWNSMVSDDRHRNTWAVGGRIGWLPYQTMLLYVSGGYTQARFGDSDLRDAWSGNRMNVRLEGHNPSGWFLGAGYEYGLQWFPNIFWKTEYRFAEYSRDRDDFFENGVRRTDLSMDRRAFIQTVRSELVWRFNFGGGSPVVARY